MVFLTVLAGAWEGRISDTSHDPLLGTSALPPWGQVRVSSGR
jgi:hypothetical protein